MIYSFYQNWSATQIFGEIIVYLGKSFNQLPFWQFNITGISRIPDLDFCSCITFDIENSDHTEISFSIIQSMSEKNAGKFF